MSLDDRRLHKTHQDFREIIADLKLCVTPRRLDISEYSIDEEGAKDLAIALHKQRNEDLALVRLDIRKNSLRSKGLKYLSRGLIGHKHLCAINLSHNYIEVIRDLSLALNQTCLNILDLSSNLIPDEELELFSQELAKNTHLFRLDLSSNKISDKGLAFIATAIESNSHLTSLVFAHNKITEEGTRLMLESIRFNRTLTEIDFDGFEKYYYHEVDFKERLVGFNNVYAHLSDVTQTAADTKMFTEQVNDKIDLLLKHNATSKRELFMKTILSDSKVKLKRSKLMVLGSPLSGKSSFCTSLIDKSYLGGLVFGLEDKFVTRLSARTGGSRNPGVAWIPLPLDDTYKELCISTCIGRLHKQQLIKKHRRDTLTVKENLDKRDELARKGDKKKFFYVNKWEQTITSAEHIADSLENTNNELISDVQVRKAAKLATSLSEMDYVDANISFDAIQYCIYDFSCPHKLKAFDSFKDLYLTKNGIIVVCLKMTDFISDLKTEGRRRKLSMRSFRSFGRQSFMSSVSGTTTTSGMSELNEYYTHDSDRSSHDTELLRTMFPDEVKPKKGIARFRKAVLKRTKRKSRKRRGSYPKNTRFLDFVASTKRLRKKRHSISEFLIPRDDSDFSSVKKENKKIKKVARNNIIESENTKKKLLELEEQLKLCKAYAPHSPILVVGTHLDLALEYRNDCVTRVNDTIAKVVQKFPEVELNRVTDQAFDRLSVGRADDAFLYYFPLSSETKVGFDVVRTKIEAATRATTLYNKKIRIRYMNVFDSLVNSSNGDKSFKLSRVLRYAKDVGIHDIEEVKGFLRLFNDLGMLMYLPISNRLEHNMLPMQFDLTSIVQRLASFAVTQHNASGNIWLRPSRTEFYKKLMSKEDLITRGLLPHLRLLSKFKVISKALLLVVFKNYHKWLDLFIEILENTFVLVKWNASSIFDIKDELYLVPAFCEDKAYNIFSSKQNSDIMEFAPTHCTLYLAGFNFRSSYLPSGLFHKLTSVLLAFAKENGKVEINQKEYIVFRRYVKLSLSFEKLGIESYNGKASFQIILREDKQKVYVIVPDHSLADLSEKRSGVQDPVHVAVRKVKSLLDSYLKKIQKQQRERIWFSYTTEYCVSPWRNEDQTFKFISERLAKRQQLCPWFSGNEFKDLEEKIDLDGFLSE